MKFLSGGLGIPAVFIIWMLYPLVHPFDGIRLPIRKHDIENVARSTAEKVGYHVQSYTMKVTLSPDNAIIRRAVRMYGLQKANELLRDSLPGYYWDVHVLKPPKHAIDLANPNEGIDSLHDAGLLSNGELRMRFSTSGALVSFQASLADSLALPDLDSTHAYHIATSFLDRHGSIRSFGVISFSNTASESTDSSASSVGNTFRFVGAGTSIVRGHTNYSFVWETRSPILDVKVLIRVAISGNLVSSYSVGHDLASEDSKSGGNVYLLSSILIIIIAVPVLMLIVGFRRLRAYEVGFRAGIVFGTLVALLYALETYAEIPSNFFTAFGTLIAPILVGGIAALGWAIAESQGREVWKEKFHALDLVTNGYFKHSEIGKAIVYGIMGGVLIFSARLVLLWGSHTLGLQSDFPDLMPDALEPLSSDHPFLTLLRKCFISAQLIFPVYLLFAVSFLRRYIHLNSIVLVAGALLIMPLIITDVPPWEGYYPIGFGCGLVLIGVLYRFNVLTAMISFFVFNGSGYGIAFFTSANPDLEASGYVLLMFGAAAIVYIVATIATKDRAVDFEAIEPLPVTHITERQRLRQELEIARSVQTSFLPKSNPAFPGLEIASRCVPALAVGGDYFDFIELGSRKLAVAIGDVSGKGTQAAFYMSLTKGFLRALCRLYDSPAIVLSEMNKLFYENVERGHFVTMLYAIFDLEHRTIVSARAGHEALLRQSKGEATAAIESVGFALGLDKGEKFLSKIQEVVLPFRPGDVFLLYTDGLTEAMSKAREEFGRDRLIRSFDVPTRNSADEILDGLFNDCKRFAGGAKQHDDMTAVVLKIVS